MAGKIIPAISSSNAIVAALQVHEVIKVLSDRFSSLRAIFLERIGRYGDEPNPDCQACSDDSRFIYLLRACDLNKVTLKKLIDIIKGRVGVCSGLTLEYNSNILYEEDDDLDEDDIEIYERRMKKSLFDLKIKDGSLFYASGKLN